MIFNKKTIFTIILSIFLISSIIILNSNIVKAQGEAEGEADTETPSVNQIIFKPNVEIGNFKGEMVVNENILGKYIDAWYKFVVGVVGILATVIIMWGGFKWLTSRGNAAAIGDAKDRIWSAIIGLVLVFLSYALLSIINPNLLIINLDPLEVTQIDIKTIQQNYESYGDYYGGKPVYTNNNNFNSNLETNNRNLLRNNNIIINDDSECNTVTGQGCRTLVGGLTANTTSGLINLQDQCNCEVIVTGGNEFGHSSNHTDGHKVDVRSTPGINSYMESMIADASESGGQTSQGYPIYEFDNGWRVIDERTNTNGGSHWDIQF